MSRYFYQRYYWQSDSRLGPLPAKFTNFLSGIGEMPDHDALEALLETAIVQDWAREWRAFEDRFTTPHAVRVSYAGMLDESEYPRLVAFTELPMRKLKAFAEEQSKETRETGREGKTRFNRRGLVGEWREWWTEEQGARLSFLADGL